MYKLAPTVEMESLDEGRCLINELSEVILLLKKTETEVFDLLLEYSMDKVKSILKERFEGETIEEDVEDFANQLNKKGFIVYVDGD